MLVRLLTNQIPTYRKIIDQTIERAIPEYQESLRTKLYEELLFGTAQCWISTDAGKFEAIIITKIDLDVAKGGKTCTLLAGYAPNGTSSASFYAGWEAVSIFAKSQGCDRIDLYTNNTEIEKYMSMFDKIWEAKYYQVSLKGV